MEDLVLKCVVFLDCKPTSAACLSQEVNIAPLNRVLCMLIMIDRTGIFHFCGDEQQTTHNE
jgi:hypothetical protein